MSCGVEDLQTIAQLTCYLTFEPSDTRSKSALLLFPCAPGFKKTSVS